MSFFKKLFGINNELADKKEDAANQKLAVPIEIKVTTTYSSDTNFEEKLKPILQDRDGNWILNPETPFTLTLLTKDKIVAQQIRDLIEIEYQDYKRAEKLVAIFAEYNLKIKEIEDYKIKYKKIYQDKIESLKTSSNEWSSLGEKDKEDLMIEFRKLAINEIYERASCNLEILFENEPQDITFDDEMIKEFGFQNMQVYIKHADNLEKIRVVPNDSSARPVFEKLVELNLAVRGASIPKQEILATLSLKELNQIAQAPDKEFKRKNQAIEFIMTLNNVDEQIGKHISLRELFKLKPLPDRYNGIDIKVISDTWNYHFEEANLLLDTFRVSYYSWRNIKNSRYVKEYSVQSHNSYAPCPCAQDLFKKKFAKDNPPKIPFHIGCDCYINQENKYD